MIFDHEDYQKTREFSADVVVVGTGAGGATAGAELAARGFDVLFVEEGAHHPTESFNPYLSESVARLYRDAGSTAILGSPPIPYVEGRCVGGSTVVNGGMAYRAPDRVLSTWARETGAAELGPRALEPFFEAVERNVHVAPQLELSVGEDSRIMTRGAEHMGWRYSVNQRNQELCVGSNNCILGCPTGAKQSTLVSYFPKAMRLGARCLTELRIEKLIIERGRCVGVEGRTINPRTQRFTERVSVRAGAVVVACGAIQTPCLLRRHGVGRESRQTGRNLYVHPNAKVLAVYPRDVRAWQGVSQNTQIREFSDEGMLFAENFLPAGVLAAHVPFHGAEAWELMQRYNQMVLSGVLIEDSTSGSVSRLLGMPYPRYDISEYDHARFIKGVRLLGTMHFEMGAELLLLPFSEEPVARSCDELMRACAAEKDKSRLELFTVHLMGTARMGKNPKSSVVDLSGQAWDLPGLFVSDASLFPGPIGVNPQLTIMALATRVASRLERSRLAA